MKSYRVTRLEIWEQVVEIEAESPEEAQRLVHDDYGEINSDAKYQGHHGDCGDWYVEEI
jgi:hypothetical protein